MRGNYWLPDEIEILNKSYPEMPIWDVIPLLPRHTKRGIVGKAKRLRLKGKRIHSEECKGKISISKRGEKNILWRGGRVKFHCLACGKEFLGYPSQPRKFCSVACLIKGKYYGERNQFICKWCGKTFERFLSVKKAQFCSNSCSQKYKIVIINADNRIRAKALKSLCKRPTAPEQRLLTILDHYLPNEWKYVGNGTVILGRLNPDFINCNSKKKLIEVFGRVYHDTNSFKGKQFIKSIPLRAQEPYRKAIYASLGFDCLVLWDDEMGKLSDEEIADRVRTFTKSRYKPTAQLKLSDV